MMSYDLFSWEILLTMFLVNKSDPFFYLFTLFTATLTLSIIIAM